MDGKDTSGIEKLRGLAEDVVGITLWSALGTRAEKWDAKMGGVTLREALRAIADQIEREHADELAAKRDLTDEACEVVERLRAIDPGDCYSGEGCWDALIDALGTNSKSRSDTKTSWKTDMALTRDRLCDLIEHGGGQDVDVAALLGLADGLERIGEGEKYVVGQLCDVAGTPSSLLGPSMSIANSAHAIAERIRKAVDAAPEPDAGREAAADWAEAQGGLDVVKAISDVLRECVERRDELLAKLGIEADDEDSESTHDAIMKELDKRLMPYDLTWPCWDDGSPVTRDDAPEHVTAVALHLDGSGYGLLDAILENAAGERVKRPETEVLGADGLPVEPGQTVYGEYDERLEVLSLDGSVAKCRCLDLDTVATTMRRAAQLTHTMPDSQERMDEEIDEFSLDDWFDRHPTDTVADVIRAFAARQRALDAKTTGGAE